LLDPFRSLLQFGQMFAWILISKLMIGDHGKSIPQRPREDNVILVHGWKCRRDVIAFKEFSLFRERTEWR
jgi:hypothetical protein